MEKQRVSEDLEKAKTKSTTDTKSATVTPKYPVQGNPQPWLWGGSENGKNQKGILRETRGIFSEEHHIQRSVVLLGDKVMMGKNEVREGN